MKTYKWSYDEEIILIKGPVQTTVECDGDMSDYSKLRDAAARLSHFKDQMEDTDEA